jgi:glycosyltransferase involved in cell wall biosynthesis
LRCLLPAKYLPAIARNELNCIQVPLEDGDIDIQFPTHEGDTAVLQFAGDSNWALFTHHLQMQGKRVLVEVDDNYLVDPGKKIRKMSNWGANIGDALHTFQGHTYIARWADGIIVTTEHLARAYRKVNENVYVIPNPVDPDDWHFDRPDDGIFRIGWFASKSHAGDGKLIERGLEWASRQKDVQVITLGFDPKWKFAYTHLPWVNDLSTWRMLNCQLDVGLAPVIAGHWSAYRSDIKASEYTMGGAAVIASEVPPYEEWTNDFSIKAASAKDFYHGIKRLVQNRDEAREMNREARKWVDENRDIRVLVEKWRQAVEV